MSHSSNDSLRFISDYLRQMDSMKTNKVIVVQYCNIYVPFVHHINNDNDKTHE